VRFEPTDIDGLFVVDLMLHEDSRGHFARTYCEREFAAAGIPFRPVQANVSLNKHKGTLRGLHYQKAPHDEAKLMRCVRGAIHLAAIDIRPLSLTFRTVVAIRLDADEHRQLYFPEGVVNGFQTLDDDSEVLYLMSEFYEPKAVAGFRYDDPSFAIEWPLEVTEISDRDLALPNFTPGSP